MSRDIFGITAPYNDDRPFILEAYDHTVQTGPAPVVPKVEPIVELTVEPVAPLAPTPVKQDLARQEPLDAAFDFRVAPDASGDAVDGPEKPV
jgi:hypothetical protein